MSEKKTTTQTENGKTNIASEVLRTIAGKSRIGNTVARFNFGSSRLQKTTAQDFFGRSKIGKTSFKTLLGNSRITGQVEQNISGSANIVNIVQLCCWIFKFRVWSTDFSPVLQSIVVNANAVNDAREIFKQRYPNGEIQDVEKIYLLSTVNGN